MDISQISSQAKEIHSFFVSLFYIIAALLLVIGVIIDYFKMPIGGSPGFPQLVGRALVAAILLSAYPEISNAVCSVSDAIADHLGSFNTYHKVLQSAGANLKDHSWSWTSLGDTLFSVVAYCAYCLLYLTVFFFDAAIIYCLVLLYVFSPVLIVFYILPQTASVTIGLFRGLFEIVTWKIVWCVLGTLLWSSALHNFETKGENFLTLLALTLMLAFSILLTPLVVKNLVSGALSSIAGQTAGLAAMGMSGGFSNPSTLSAIAQTHSRRMYVAGAKVPFRMAGGIISKVRKRPLSKKVTAKPAVIAEQE